MNIREFYDNFKKALESDTFTELLLCMGDINSDARRLFIVKSIYFLISTRNFDGFEKFLDRYYRDIFPYEYLKENTNLSDDEVKCMIYNNFIKNGFLFHVTPRDNVDEILSSGLRTLNDKYKCDLYNKSLELNDTYSQIRQRNSGLTELFKMPTLINIPGIEKYHEDRFKTVYLSSNLDYILKTYGEDGELFSFFISDLLWVFNNCDDVNLLNKDELKSKIIQIIKESNAQIFDEEITQILDYFETVYEDKQVSQNSNKSILLVPTRSIVSNSTYFDSIYLENSLNLPLEIILEFHNGEVGSAESILPDNIIAINCNKDKGLSLKIKR